MPSQITASSVPKELELKITTAIELKKQLEQYEKEIKEELVGAMQANGIVSIKNDAYSISLASRPSYSVAGADVPDGFAKSVLDTSKVGMHEKLYGSLPDGVEKKVTTYVTWRAK